MAYTTPNAKRGSTRWGKYWPNVTDMTQIATNQAAVNADIVTTPAASVAPQLTDRLSPRELDVWKALARGLSNHEIANTLFVSEATVKTHVARILAKLDLRDRAQAIITAYETGLVQPGQ